MISHRYEDYANRLGIHTMDALIAVLFWPTLVVIALWWWRGMPTVFGGGSTMTEDMKTVVINFVFVMCLAAWLVKKLKWLSIPFGLDDPRRAMAYPSIIYVVKFLMLGLPLTTWATLAPHYAPQLEPHKLLICLIPTGIMVIGMPTYVYRVIKLWKRKDLCPETDEEG